MLRAGRERSMMRQWETWTTVGLCLALFVLRTCPTPRTLLAACAEGDQMHSDKSPTLPFGVK
jgi:hypothetical protein